jgi:cobalt-zinc-cadmium efflux system membrane fusion protein
VALPLAMAAMLTGCGRQAADPPTQKTNTDKPKAADGNVTLTPAQIATAGIEVVRPTIGEGGGTIELPATIIGDPQGTQVVSAALAGRVVALTRNLGEAVGRGTTLAIIESREAAQLKGEVEASRARLALARSNLAREQRLFDQRVSPEQDLVAARTAATEAGIAYRQAQGQVAATGTGAGALNRIAIVSPIAGTVIGRGATLGQTVAADAELYRVARLGRVSLSLALSPANAGLVRPGARVTVTAPGRQGVARIGFVSPALDPDTKLVSAIATLDNRDGRWRLGEPVSAAVELATGHNGLAIKVPSTAVQTVEGKTVVFVRTPQGFKAVPVTLGQGSGDAVIVASGLTGREQVAAGNSFTLKSALGAVADED